MLKKRGRVQLFRCTTKVGRTEFPLLIPKRDNNAKVEVKFSRILMQKILENRQSCEYCFNVNDAKLHAVHAIKDRFTDVLHITFGLRRARCILATNLLCACFCALKLS